MPVAVSGANFGVAETGTIGVFESEGNGRMCLTLPRVLVSVMGIEKVVPDWRDIEVFLQLLPRSSTAERMNPYTSFWTGVRPGDGPEEFHLVLLDNGRTNVLADEVGRQALHCIRCSACLNICPVYARTGGHAYNSVYPGPIGAILTPQLRGLEKAPSLPYASSLCGACYEVCPVQDQHPDGPGPPPRPGRARGARARAAREKAGDAGGRAASSARAGATRRRRSSRGSAAGRSAAWAAARPAWARGRRRATSRDPGAELPRVVGEPGAQRRGEAASGAGRGRDRPGRAT